MKILYLMPLFPFPPNAGGKAVSYRNLELLSQKHAIDLCCFAWSKNDWDNVDACRKFYRQLIMIGHQRKPAVPFFVWHNILGIPYYIYRNYSPSMRVAITRILEKEKYDIVFIDTMSMMPYLPLGNRVKAILETQNAESEILLRFAATLPDPMQKLLIHWEVRNLKRFEVASCLKVDKVLTLSSRDKAHLVEWNVPTEKIFVGPTYVDDLLPQPTYHGEGLDIVHVGAAHWPPNVDGILWFVKRIFPLIKRTLPSTRFLIVGKEPPHKIARLHNGVDILVLGFVEDIEKIYSNTGAFIIPLRIGSGIRIKIINAMTRGLPIVSTAIGCEGMDVVNGRHLLIADKAEEFADAVISLLNSKEIRISLGKAAHAFCLKRYSRNQRSLFLEDVLSSLKNN
jgi:glycosyltransferase involved in cell wall biosynthesis